MLPAFKLIPIRAECPELIDALRDKIEIKGEILSTEARWHDQP